MAISCKSIGIVPLTIIMIFSHLVQAQYLDLCGGVENRYICDISDPKVFHICLGGNKFRMECPGVLNFNPKSQVCDWPAPGLCPYDGYSGMDSTESEDEEKEEGQDLFSSVDVYNTNSILPLQDERTEPAPAPVRENPYKNRVNQYSRRRDFNSFGNALEDAEEKQNGDTFLRRPKSSAYRSSRRTGRRRLRTRRPSFNSAAASNGRRTKARRSRSGRQYSPFSPPLDVYSYHAKNMGQSGKETTSDQSRRYYSNTKRDLPRNTGAASKRTRSSSSRVKHETIRLDEETPSWLSKHFSDRREAPKVHESKNRRHQNSFQREEILSNPKINHWIEVLGLTGMPDSYRNDVSPRMSKSRGPSPKRGGKPNWAPNPSKQAPNPAGRQSHKSQGVYHSANLNKAIYPYRPQESGVNQPPAVSFKNKFALAQQKQGNKANGAKSYNRNVSNKSNKKKGKCNSSWCQLPTCRCVGQDIPGGLPKQEVPMMVMLTFDDGVNANNFGYYKALFNGSIRNPNGCPFKSTFFVSGDSTQYDMVHRLTKDGHEIASHTLSHRAPTTWWANAGLVNWQQEVVGMKNRLADKAGVARDSIQGMRAPYLQVGGDAQYAMLYENKFRYDSSMVSGNLYENHNRPIWPFTLDSPPDSQTCNLPPCPTRSYPGLWEVPLIRWYGSNHFACAMPDACIIDSGIKGSLDFLKENFNRHYKTNKAPFGIFIHASWFKRKDGNFEGLLHFLRSLADRKDVWLVTVSQMLDWVQYPKGLRSVSDIPSWQC